MSESPPPAADGFPGFPSGARTVPVPAALFSAVLPRMDDPAELLVTLYAVHAAHRLRSFPRLLDLAALRAERGLAEALARMVPGTGLDAAFQRGVDAAVARGTLLRVDTADASRAFLAVNTAVDRRAIDRLRRGELAPPLAGPAFPAELRAAPNIYALYEQTIGPILPQIAEDLADAEHLYPWPWVEAAFREAADLNKRSWRYVRRILERWQENGGPDATPERLPGKRPDPRYEPFIRR